MQSDSGEEMGWLGEEIGWLGAMPQGLRHWTHWWLDVCFFLGDSRIYWGSVYPKGFSHNPLPDVPIIEAWL